MQTECSAKASEFARVEGRPVIAEFDGGALTSDAGGCCWERPTRRWVWLIGSRAASGMRVIRS